MGGLFSLRGQVYFRRNLPSLHSRSLALWISVLILHGVVGAQSTSASQPALSYPALHRGTNEFGLWTGYSPFSFLLKGTIKDRQLFLLNLQYARTLLATRPLTLKYTAEIVPVALEFQPTQRYVVDGKLLVNHAATIYGTGANPIGVQANFGTRKVQPFTSGTLGFLYFNRQVPVVGSSQFNYNIAIGFGAQFFLRPGRSFSMGWKYHHLSNDNQAHLNPGLDSGVFYLGFSLIPTKPAR
jgi:hypothetical protein